MCVLYLMINNKGEQQEKDRRGREIFLVKSIKWVWFFLFFFLQSMWSTWVV